MDIKTEPNKDDTCQEQEERIEESTFENQDLYALSLFYMKNFKDKVESSKTSEK